MACRRHTAGVTWLATNPHAKTDYALAILRHTHATLPLESGEHPKVVQDRLGHFTITTPMNI